MLRVDNTEHTQPILFMAVTAWPNDGIHAKDTKMSFASMPILEIESASKIRLQLILIYNENPVDRTHRNFPCDD